MDRTDALIVLTKWGHIGRVGPPKGHRDPDAREAWAWYGVFLDDDEPEIRIGPAVPGARGGGLKNSSPYAIWASDELHAYQQLLAAHEGKEVNKYNFYCDAVNNEE